MNPPVAADLHDAAPADWADFVRRTGSFYHEPGWCDALERAFGFRMQYATARDADGALVGAMPVAHVRSVTGGRRLVSLPFSYCAGPAATSHVAAHALAARVRDAAATTGARVEIKWMPGADAAADDGYARTSRYAAYRLPLVADEASALRLLHKDHVQRGIKKADREGVVAARGASAADWLAMAMLQEETSHRLGLPAPPRAFFTEHCVALERAGLARVYVARHESELLGALVCWTGAREWIYAFGASRQEALEKRPNHALLWRALRDAVAAGVVFDLGRAADEQTGLVQFKRRWGGVEHRLAYDYWPEAKGLNTAPRDRGAVALVNRAWSALPLSVARRGSFLYKYLA